MAHYGKSLISIFQEFPASINKIFILAGQLGTMLSFYDPKSEVVRQLVRQLVYSMYISNNRASFHYYIFLKKASENKLENFFNTKFNLSEKIGKAVIK